ncbi:MAG: site-specific integrase [Promicromonosporaceae bacterium]|nr:site-specific integrase [Promicromonosporaceae bacterium]
MPKKISRAEWGTVETLKSGRYRAIYTAPDGSRQRAPQTYPTKTDARAWLATQRARIVEGTWTPETPIKKHVEQRERAELHTAATETLQSYGERWIEERLHKGLPLRDSTKQGYRHNLAKLAPLTKLPLNEITDAKIRRWYRNTLPTGITSTSHAYSRLTSMLKDAADAGLIPENPCRIKGAVSARTGIETEPPTAAELAIIVANTPDRFQALVTLAAWSALRYGEQTELRRNDIVDDGNQILIRVRRGVTRIAGQGFVVGPPKTARSKRDVVLPPAASATLRAHIAKHVPDHPEALLFPATNGGHLNESSKNRWWYKAREKAGRPDLPWHGLRHYGLTQYAKAGATLAELMARAGHSTTQAAMIYQHATGRDAELARKMENA